LPRTTSSRAFEKAGSDSAFSLSFECLVRFYSRLLENPNNIRESDTSPTNGRVMRGFRYRTNDLSGSTFTGMSLGPAAGVAALRRRLGRAAAYNRPNM
jgi:hypothetical protein